MVLQRYLNVFLVLLLHKTASMSLAKRYFERLRLDPSKLDLTQTMEKLAIIQEAHLQHIPFENTAQHGVVGGLPSLDYEKLVEKVLLRKRGGFCFELNGLLSIFLEELGYDVNRVRASVCGSRSTEPSHMILVVGCHSAGGKDCKYLVDVGFGEPSIHPLRFEFDLKQVTPEGMTSRLIKGDDGVVTLQWLKLGTWDDRIKFSLDDATSLTRNHLSTFTRGLSVVLQEGTIFSEKLIVCKITKEQKVTLAGNRFKVTGPPRFAANDANEPQTSIKFLQSEEEVRVVLRDVFDQPMESTEGLNLSKSLIASNQVWSQL